MATKPAPIPPALLTIEAVAELCATTPRQIRNMQARGQIPAPKRIPGLGLRWSAEAITQWLTAVAAP